MKREWCGLWREGGDGEWCEWVGTLEREESEWGGERERRVVWVVKGGLIKSEH